MCRFIKVIRLTAEEVVFARTKNYTQELIDTLGLSWRIRDDILIEE